MTAKKLRFDPLWTPVATIRIGGPDGDVIAFKIVADNAQATELDLVMSSFVRGKEQDTSIGRAQIGATVPFQVVVTRKGITIRAAGQEFTAKADWKAPPLVAASCSTGEFVFDNLRFSS